MCWPLCRGSRTRCQHGRFARGLRPQMFLLLQMTGGAQYVAPTLAMVPVMFLQCPLTSERLKSVSSTFSGLLTVTVVRRGITITNLLHDVGAPSVLNSVRSHCWYFSKLFLICSHCCLDFMQSDIIVCCSRIYNSGTKHLSFVLSPASSVLLLFGFYKVKAIT